MSSDKIDSIDQLFDYYTEFKNKSGGSEYFLNVDEGEQPTKVSTHLIYGYNILSNQQHLILKTKTKFIDEQVDENTRKHSVLYTLKQNTIKRFHPNRINNKQFWKMAKTNFPLFSVCGSEVKTLDECNNQTFKMVSSTKLIEFIENHINKLGNESLNFFEIGYGHGNLYFHLKNNFPNVKYTGIDYYKLPEFDQFNELKVIDKSGIPDYIEPNSLDIVYSFNVLQHCSQKDRNDYFEQAFDKLKINGYFVGGIPLSIPGNDKDEKLWGYRDRTGRKYMQFFGQFTEVDTIDEFTDIIKNIGYSIEYHAWLDSFYLAFILKKQ